MKKEESILSILGIASKTGNLIFGQKALKTYISSLKKEKLVVFASNYGDSVETLVKKCQNCGVPFIKLNVDKAKLGKAIGKEEISAVGILEKTFIDGINKLINDGGI